MGQARSISVELKLLGTNDISGVWTVNDKEQQAAWEIYVELVTRIPVVELRSDEGLLSEALSSLYSLFDSTREVLRSYGPELARTKSEGELSFASLSITLLNGVLRPVLAQYHPLLLDFESVRPQQVPPGQHERNWRKSSELRQILNVPVRDALIQYANLFAQAAAVPLTVERNTN